MDIATTDAMSVYFDFSLIGSNILLIGYSVLYLLASQATKLLSVHVCVVETRMPTSKQSFEFEGPNALETAKTILSNYDISGELQSISVELEERHESEGEPTEGNEQSTEDGSRELKQIRSGTNHHKVLKSIKKLHDKGRSPVSGSKVFEDTSNVKEASVYASLSKLWQRRLVERERVKEGGNSHFVYKISGYGKQELSRIGD